MTDDPQEGMKAEDLPLPGGDFRLFITRLSFQGLLSCGLLENPVTKTKAVNLGGARMVLDDLRMLREKTVGNLDDEETELLDKTIEQLTQAYGLAMNGEIPGEE